MIEWLNARAQVVTRFNRAILDAPNNLIDLDHIGFTGKYLGTGKASTIWVVTDLNTEVGKNLLRESVTFLLDTGCQINLLLFDLKN